MTAVPSARRRALLVVGATVVTGLVTYVFLGIVSRSVAALAPDAVAGDAAFDMFSVFWSVALVVGFGLFLPVEQELARLGAHGVDVRAAVRSALGLSGAVALVGLVAVAAASPLLLGAGMPIGLVVAYALIAPVSALQFTARGSMVARGDVTAYSRVLLADSGLRVTLALGALLLLTALDLPDAVSWFAAALLAAIALAHVPVLLRLRGGRADAAAGAVDPAVAAVDPVALATGPVPAASPGTSIRRAYLALLGAGVCAQLLLNAGPVVIAALDRTVGTAGAFQATFSVARVPLFMLVPLQGLIVPPLVAYVRRGETAALIRRMTLIAAAVAGVGVVAGVVAALVGPWVIELVFGSGRSLPGLDVGILVLGVFTHVGLVIGTQALIATDRHRDSSIAWVAALVVAAAATALLQGPLGWATAIAAGFGGGSLVGWIVALLRLRAVGTRHARTARTRTLEETP
ncbi:O-antigen/teichoic acid export membrane protein [Clavibacter michiganensis]|nr:O-antigen/teichoic acid export membrane protein [Clavibacter michiganensis]